MRLFLIAGWLVVLAASSVRAQAVCPTEVLKDPNMTLADMYAKAEARATAWKPDVVVSGITNTVVGTLQDSGKSATWVVEFYSPSAKQQVSIQVLNGSFNCFAMQYHPESLPNLQPGFFKDSAKLYAIAKDKGAEYLAKGYRIEVELHTYDKDHHTTWNISYWLKDDSAAVMVLVDANTGAFQEVVE